MTRRAGLRALARALGIQDSYIPDGGGPPRKISDRTREALVAALGYDASDEAAATRSLAAFASAGQDRVLPESQLLRVGTRRLGLGAAAKRLHDPIAVTIHEEGGRELDTSVERARGGRACIPLPALPIGFHLVSLRDAAGTCASGRIIATPDRCTSIDDLPEARGRFGIWANLYSARGESDLGFGNIGTLRELIRFAAAHSAAFVGLNPLHSLRNRIREVSPYSPTSRLFRNALYVDVRAVPEFERSPEAQAYLEGQGAALRRLRAATTIDSEAVARIQWRTLRTLHDRFLAEQCAGETERGSDYSAFVQRAGTTLSQFALFCALEEHLAQRGTPRDFRCWPNEYRRRDTSAVRLFAREHAREIDLHCWVQFELDRQLGEAAADARQARMPIGLYTDLALGSAPSGFDAWAFADLLVPKVTLGAPPDAFAEGGQDWGLPPMNPAVLRSTGYDYWSKVLRTNLRHAGALRIDHILGVVRQWWIPEGFPAREGAYVRYPHRELLAVLALESRRAGAVIIGEDLGTVPRGLRRTLANAGVLSSQVMAFERERGGRFRTASRYSKRALATANTHDLPPLASFWTEADLELRHSLDLYSEPGAWNQARAERDRTRLALKRRLERDGLLEPHQAQQRDAASARAVTAAVHRFLCRTPSPLVGISLDDLAQETEPINLPGVPSRQHPSWTRRMRSSIAQLEHDPQVKDLLPKTERRARTSDGSRPGAKPHHSAKTSTGRKPSQAT